MRQTLARLVYISLAAASLVACSVDTQDGSRAISPPIVIPAAPTADTCATDLPEDDIGIYLCSWEHRALTLQRELGYTLPLREVGFFSSHNSANAVVYTGASSQDYNQTRSVVDQFQLDVRSIEFDVHWLPHNSGGHAPVLCHGLPAGQEHAGCTAGDRHFQEGLDEIRAFLESEQGANQVIIFDFEDHLYPAPFSGQGTTADQAHDAGLSIIIETLGDAIYLPPQDGACHDAPMDISLNDILAAGKQILFTGGCGPDGHDWRKFSFGYGTRPAQKANDGFDSYPDCESSTFSETQYRNNWIRLWEDTTQVGAITNSSLQRMDEAQLRSMASCGVNFSSLDRVDPNPTATGGNPNFQGQGINFAHLVWSWAAGQPAVNTDLECASLETSGEYFLAGNCSQTKRYACLQDGALDNPIADPTVLWQISTESGGASGSSACVTLSGYSYAVPRSGWLKQKLLEAMAVDSVTSIWLNYRETNHNEWE
jgi:hypothetical protein